MPPELFVHLLPELAEPQALRGGTAVVIDVLRASTTIVHALAAGAEAVIPCETVEEAREEAARLPERPVLLGGERGGRPIEGFDLGNSPLDYTAQTVGGRTIVFTTTNGTRALAGCRDAGRVLVGAFVNLTAVVDVLLEEKRPVHLVCAGTDGRVTAEDVLCAGAVVFELLVASGSPDPQDDAARIAVDFYRLHSHSETGMAELIRNSRGGRNLKRVGYEADIQLSARRDLCAVVPEYSTTRNVIVAR